MIAPINGQGTSGRLCHFGTNDGHFVASGVMSSKKTVQNSLAAIDKNLLDKNLGDNSALKGTVQNNRLVNKIIFSFGAVVGGMVPLLMIKQSSPTWKKMIGVIAGVLSGLLTGFASVVALNLPKDFYKKYLPFYSDNSSEQ